MKYQNTLIKPDGSVNIQTHDTVPYFHAEFFNQSHTIPTCDDIRLADGQTHVHTRKMEDGLHVLIVTKTIQNGK